MSVAVCAESFRVADYDLAATLQSGQAFRWTPQGGGWEGVIGQRWVRLRQTASDRIDAEAAAPVAHWNWLRGYLRLDDNLAAMLATFPPDPPLQAACTACRGLRLLAQDPWECLASFILSSTKQIVQIRQIVERLCVRFGTAVESPAGTPSWRAFPSAERLAALPEETLRSCGMGFRAPYLLAAARAVAAGQLDLAALPHLPLSTALARLQTLPGVGPKIAHCVLLFTGAHETAFPVDVWVFRALRQLYFPRRQPSAARLRQFTATHFGPHAGLAQQYLFHHVRTQIPRS